MRNRKIIPDFNRGEVQDIATPEQLAIIEKSNREALACIDEQIAEAEQKRDADIESGKLPIPLPDRLEVDFFDISILPSPIVDWAHDVSHRSSCPIEYSALGGTMALSAALGKSVAVLPKRHDNWHEYGNLWGMVVGSPSSMKSHPVEEMLKPLEAIQARQGELVSKDLIEWDKVAEIINIKNSAIKEAQKKATKDAINNDEDLDALDVTPLIELPPRPTKPCYLAKDITPEKLETELADNPRGIMVYRDELRALFNTFTKAGHESARTLYLSGWSGKQRLDTKRMSRDEVSLDAYSLGVIGTIQPGPLGEFVSAAGTKGDDGLMQRFGLMAWPDDSLGFRSVDDAPNEIAKRKYIECIERMATINQKGGQRVGYEVAGVKVPALRFSEDASTVFDEWMCNHMNALKRSKECEALESHLSKYRKLVPALALLDHVAELNRFDSTEDIGRKSVEKAILWAAVMESHARKVYSNETSPEIEKAKRLLDKAREISQKNPKWTVRDIYHAGRRGMKTAKEVEPVIEILISYGHVYSWRNFPNSLKKGQYIFHECYH